jgi:hypothetical protein
MGFISSLTCICGSSIPFILFPRALFPDLDVFGLLSLARQKKVPSPRVSRAESARSSRISVKTDSHLENGIVFQGSRDVIGSYDHGLSIYAIGM